MIIHQAKTNKFCYFGIFLFLILFFLAWASLTRLYGLISIWIGNIGHITTSTLPFILFDLHINYIYDNINNPHEHCDSIWYSQRMNFMCVIMHTRKNHSNKISSKFMGSFWISKLALNIQFYDFNRFRLREGDSYC